MLPASKAAKPGGPFVPATPFSDGALKKNNVTVQSVYENWQDAHTWLGS